MRLTRRILQASRILQLHLVDHVMIQTLVVYFNLDLVTGLEIAVDCFVAVSLEQLVPRADGMDPVLAYNNLRWHSLDGGGRNHLSDGLHRKLDLVSSTHCGKAKAEDGYCYEVAYSVHSIRGACGRTKPTLPFGRSLSNRRLDLCGRTSPQKILQTGFMQLFTGSVVGIRNPHAHENFTLDFEEAKHFLYLADVLMRKFKSPL